ncbi:aspartyl protease family protein [Candidatus Pacearchaeota archaeon]|nr:aspartyl protease family protein [Candidatus Pacearchaeota archaeon]
MTLTFRYKRVKRPNDIEIKSPSIPVMLSGTGTKYQFIALLDSGADVSVIPKEVAELLGLDLNKRKEEARGIGGIVPAIQTNMNIELGKPHEMYSFNIPVKVVLSEIDEEIPVLLGRAGFFDKFVISFDQKEERVTLKRNVNS